MVQQILYLRSIFVVIVQTVWFDFDHSLDYFSEEEFFIGSSFRKVSLVHLYTIIFVKAPNFLPISTTLNFSNSELKIFHKLFLSSKDVSLAFKSKQFLLMFASSKSKAAKQ